MPKFKAFKVITIFGLSCLFVSSVNSFAPIARALTMQEIIQGYDNPQTLALQSGGQVLGATTLGNTNTGVSNSFDFNSNALTCSNVTSPSGGGTVTAMSAVVGQAGGGAGNIVFGIYSDSGGSPNTLLASNSSGTAVPATPGSVTGAVSYALPASPTALWFCILASNTNNAYYYTNTGGSLSYHSATYPTFPSPYSGGGQIGSDNAEIYATYTSGGGDVTPPSVPTNLNATAVSASAINLSWTASTDNVGVTGYTIYRGGTQIATSATNSYSDTGLSASTQYTYTVSAYDAAGNNSSQSTSTSATTQAAAGDTTPPSTPTNLSATAVSSSAINLSWTASTDNVGVTGYKIYRGGVQVGTSATNSYSDTGLSPSTQYTYTVSAYDAAGNNSSQSSSASATTQAQSSSGTPTLIQHVATGMDQNGMGTLTIPLPNLTGAGNALILGLQFRSNGSVSSVTDNKGNTWTAGPGITNSTYSQSIKLYYALNIAAGTQAITVNFSGSPVNVQAVISEFYNVAQVSAADGSGSNASSRTVGSFTTTSSGDLIYHWGVDFSDNNPSVVNGGGYNGTSITAGAGFTLLSADLQVGSGDQYEVQSSAGSINPTFTASGSATWGSLALALKSAAVGTPPPSGMRIIHIQHTLLAAPGGDTQGGGNQGRSTPIIMQFPSSGNLLVGMLTAPQGSITAVTDSASNTWSAPASALSNVSYTSQLVYAANAATSPNLSNIKVTYANEASSGGMTFDLYDIVGAAASPFDKATTANGSQTSNGNLTTASLTPSTSNGVVFNVTAIGFHDLEGVTGSGYMADIDTNSLDNDAGGTNGTPNSTMDEDNGIAHIYNTNTNALTFTYTNNASSGGSPSGIQTWAAADAAFKSAGSGGGGDTTPPSTPTNLSATAISSSAINLSWTASTDNVGVTGYKIFRVGVQVGTSATNSYSDTGLSASTQYTYVVSAYDAAGNNSAQSSSASATTQAQQSGGTTINAASCSESDVATALASITTDGTTVIIPAGNCTWTTALSYTQTKSFTLQGAGAVSGTGLESTINGTGVDNTIIQDNINRSGNDVALLNITTAAGKSFRMTGIAFTYSASNSTVTGNGDIRIGGLSTSVRIDHNHINQINNVDLLLAGAIMGVVDHNQFDSSFADENQIRCTDPNWNGDAEGLGNSSWADGDHFGTSEFMYIEDNNFQRVTTEGAGQNGGFVIDAGLNGGRCVVRFNAMGYHTALQTHGTGGGTQDHRGLRAIEVYGNTFNWSSNPTVDQFAFLVQLEGGTSLWWGNNITGFNQFIHEDTVRTNNATYAETATPNGYGYCGTGQGAASNWDGNTNSTGYPCLDQVGRGAGDLLSGDFPNKVDTVTNSITWPHQILDPVYVWDNTYNPVPQEPDVFWSNYDSATVENRDYYLQLPNYGESSIFNGTTGVGQGTLASRPSTCTTGVAYWATDQGNWNQSGSGGQGELFVCSATNTWTLYYEPYTYPHPLDTSGSGSPPPPDTTPPSPPTGVTVN